MKYINQNYQTHLNRGGISVNEYYYSIDPDKLIEVCIGGEYNNAIRSFLESPVNAIVYNGSLNKIIKQPWYATFTEEEFRNYRGIHISDILPHIVQGVKNDEQFILEIYGDIYNRVYQMFVYLGGITYEQIYQMISQAIMEISKEEYENMITLKTTIIK